MKRQTKLFRLAVFAMLHAVLVATLAPVTAVALDVQELPTSAKGAHGFTHGALVTWDDLNATDNAATTLQLMRIPTNSYIDRVAWVIEEQFTNSTVSATNLLLCLGVGGSTNAFYTTNQVDGSDTMINAGKTLFMLSTNMVVPYKSTTSTNYLIATYSAASSVVDTYVKGRMRIYWRLVQPARIDF